MLKKLLFVLGIMLLLAAAAFGWLKFHDIFKEGNEDSTDTTQGQSSNGGNNQQTTQTGFDKTKYSTDEPGSLWWVVNKTRPLPDGYIPPALVVPDVKLRLSTSAEQMHLRDNTATAYETLVQAATSEGLSFTLSSGYRSEAYQRQLYASYVAKDGQAAADQYSARPGTSEHQTGLSLDVRGSDASCELDACFADTPEGKWVATNGYKYGFILRYPEGKTPITGYEYEPWHLRYVGTELATEMHNTGIQTLEEFFGLPAAPDYL